MAAVSISHNRHVLLACCYALGLLVMLSTSCTTTRADAAAAATSTSRTRRSSNKLPHLQAAAASGGYRTFIVLLERPTGGGEMDAAAHRAWHESLPSKETELGEPRLLRSYCFLVNGFAARLTEAEVQQVASKPGFVAAFPNVIRYLQMTHTPGFLGLLDSGAGHVSTWKDSAYGSGVIIGLVDAGINPRHPAMADIVMEGDVPKRWKGSCHEGFPCNRKLIGAKNLVQRGQPPEDVASGHGTHAATIAAGTFVNDVSISGGLANGTASGMAPGAHVAVYKACGDDRDDGCPDDAILSAMDEAVKDGVDIISLSLGGPFGATYDHDVIAVAAFSAMQNGVVVIACAGNVGPDPSTVANEAPWMITVGAGTVDRSLEAKVRVTAGDPFLGESLADRKGIGANPGAWYPLLYREEGARRFCLYPEWESDQLRDKIVICQAGMSDPEVVQVSYDELDRLKDYASWPAATASIELGGTVLGSSTPAPIVASFSGRGPSKRSPGILKPDLLAPGVNILAGAPDVHRHVRHVHVHAARRHILDEHRATAASAYATGAGHANVARALDPGLIYDVNQDMYAGYVCSILGEAALRRITRDNSRTCLGYGKITGHKSNLNYPTITVPLQPAPFVVVRIVTNVAPLGPPESYTIKVDMPPEVRVTVTPSTLNFTSPWEQAAYALMVSSIDNSPVDGRMYQGSVTLTSPSHTVRTPMLAVVGMATPRPSTGWRLD
ncbi:hypothetical protein C2845_PM13G11070 [Panicum miliaceum]|uniref:Subtilisin-like protease SBT1.2 n=1 Tax=Panicum miliaceum TaxID=4540 RepID=A0A3L6RIS4_PANMI|nr:hypothetical protein C2845_PM13G11070 [Panicum miliaceum]